MANNEIIQFKDDIENYIEYLSNSEGDIIKSDIKNILNILSTNEKNVRNLENQGPIKRVWNNITGKNKKLKEINANNLLNVQKLSLGIISELEKQNMMTREVQVMIFNKLNDIAESNLQLKNFIVEVLNKIADRFENIESQTSFNTLIHEIKEGIYDNNLKILSLLKIVSNLSLADIKDDRNMNLLCKVLENRNIIDEKEEALKIYLEDISTFRTEDASDILEKVKYYEDDSIISCIIQSLKYSSIDEKKKKFMKFTKTLNIIEENIEIEAELSGVELFKFIIEEIREKSNIIKIQNKPNETLYNDEIEYIALTEEIDIVECNEVEDKTIINEYISIEKELFIDNLETKEFINKNIKINSEIKVDGKLSFENCNVELNEKIRILSNNYKIITEENLKNYETAKDLFRRPTVKFKNCNINIDGKLKNYIEIGEVSELESHTPELAFEDSTLQYNGNIDINTIAEKSIISLTGRTDINFDNTIINNLYNLIIINKNLKKILSMGGNNDINIAFTYCKFNSNRGYIVHRGSDLNILMNNCEINNYTPIINLEIEIETNVNSRYWKIDKTKGKYIINCDCKKIVINNCKFNDINLPVLAVNSANLIIDKCKFNRCISTYEIMNIRFNSFGPTKTRLEDTNFDNCSAIVINTRISINKCNFRQMKSIEVTAEKDDINNKGGAIYSTGNDLSIYNCKFIGCEARVGGAIYTYGGKGKKVEDCEFQDCIATKFGGAIRVFSNDYNTRNSVNVKNCEFVGCSCGEGIDKKYIVDYRCKYNDSTFFNKKFESFDSARLENCSFSE